MHFVTKCISSQKLKSKRTMNNSSILQTISPYIYGTTRLGDDQISVTERVKVVRAAMDSGVWVHTSHQYGSAEQILRKAFDEDRTHVPNLIIKMGGNSVADMITDVTQNMQTLGIETLQIGQLCMWDDLALDFANAGSSVQDLIALKKSGLVQNFVLEVFPWTSINPLQALKAGHMNGLIDAFIMYVNPLQRFASNELWDEILHQHYPVIAMRTISGGPVYALRDVPGAAWVPYLQERAVEVAPIFEKSGIPTWTEFCVRYAHSIPVVKATVGTSSKVERLQEFLQAAKHIQPLQESIMNEISALQYRWSKETDVKAEPWSM